MRSARICIVGAGLSGLYAGWLLQRHGFDDYVILEARHTLGGRIDAFAPPGGDERFDLGPTWYWPDYQADLHDLIKLLDLSMFPQHEDGDTVLERAIGAPPTRTGGYVSAPQAMRLEGGMRALIDALRQGINPSRIVTGQRVKRICRLDGCIELDSLDEAGKTLSWRAEHVLLALPPRLASQTITFVPALPSALSQQWQDTATWMAPHAKYIAVYDRPFWREQGLSGKAHSAVGPLGEIHDASAPEGAAALFGFFRIPAQIRSTVPAEVLRAHCRAQLARLFGTAAGDPVVDAIKDWASDPLTAVHDDLAGAGHHGHGPAALVPSGAWQASLTGIASEFSPRFPGYLAGAVEAADIGVGLALRAVGANAPLATEVIGGLP